MTDLLGFYLCRCGSGAPSRCTLNTYFLDRALGRKEQPGDDSTELTWSGSHEPPERIAFRRARQVSADWSDSMTVEEQRGLQAGR